MNSAVIKTFIEERQVDSPLRERLESFSGSDLSAVERLISEIRPSANTMRDILTITDEICARDRRLFADILAGADFESILAAESLPRKEKTRQIKELLYRLRYPLAHDLREQIETARQALIARYGVKLTLPKDLEGDSLTVTLSIRSLDDAHQAAALLEKLAGDPDLARTIDILKGSF